ncbi:hypothetical protein [Ureibacillus thermophilus]|uniref:Uncharacterized protein n=1 Tax=Ureibacillus thermophilus TaxID=367743 RepID=A0A4V1A3B9_9BACL|nr:hypothetical protein [Ureibacillus thermophilus]QBK26710.1 hypothetical protein DKZ56_13145 [Ureibacillus thermophilus]
MTEKRITLLETVDGKQFKSRYHDTERTYFALKEDIIISCSKYSSGILVFARDEDDVFDYIGDIQIDKEDIGLTEIYIHSRGIQSLQLNHSDHLGITVNNDSLKDVTIQIDEAKSKQFKEKKFFDF